jgi:hypothetical protein
VGSDLPPGVFGFDGQLFDSICAMVYFDLRHGVNRFTGANVVRKYARGDYTIF